MIETERPPVVLLPASAPWGPLVVAIEPWMQPLLPVAGDAKGILEELTAPGVERFALVAAGGAEAAAGELAHSGRVAALVLIGCLPAGSWIELVGDIPVFIIWGEDDDVIPAAAAEHMAAQLPGSTLAFVPGCGHGVIGDEAHTIFPLVFEYLRSRYAGRGHAHDHVTETIQILTKPPVRP